LVIDWNAQFVHIIINLDQLDFLSEKIE